jgi:hypothetical protein
VRFKNPELRVQKRRRRVFNIEVEENEEAVFLF